MNRKKIMTGILCFVTLLCIGCGKKEEIADKKEPVATSTGEAISTATPVATLAPVVEKGSIYVKKNTHKWQGVYKGKNQEEDATLYIHRVAGENLWFSFETWDNTYQYGWEDCYIRATKTTENSYEFHYDTWNSQDGTMKWDGDIVFKGEKVLFNIGCEEDFAPSHFELNRKNIKSADTSDSVIELARCLNKSYRKVKEELSGKKPSIFNIGKETGRDRISYIEIGADGDEKLDKNLGYYQIKGVGIWGTKEECKKILGTPTEEHTYELRYETEDGYEICFNFYHDYVKKMGIYFGSKKEALEEKENNVAGGVDLNKCVDNYFEVREKIYANGYVEGLDFGKEPGGKRVSYVEAVPSESSAGIRIAIGNGISFSSSKEECNRALGKPIRETEKCRVYKYKDDYEIQIEFAGDEIKTMGIYLKDKETAKKLYTVGEFSMRGCQIVNYNNNYQKTGTVKIPEDTVSIEEDAFKADSKNFDISPKGIKRIKLEIPKDVYIEPYAFRSMGPADITFEEGRKEIEEGAFASIGSDYYNIKITLPSSVKTIQKRSFSNEVTGNNLTVNLNKGLEIIGDEALCGLKCDLPKTIRIIKDGALKMWKPKGNFSLPEGVEEIGSHCFWWDGTEKPFRIPSTVKKIGINPFEFGDSALPEVQVDPRNPYFKSDENGWLLSKDGKIVYSGWVSSQHNKIPDGVEYLACSLTFSPDEGVVPLEYPLSYKGELKEKAE